MAGKTGTKSAVALRRRNRERAARRAARGGEPRSRADRQLAQGTGKAVTKAFQPNAPKSSALKAWDAFDPQHAPLPRATGPYAVVRTSKILTTSAKYVQFGAFLRGRSQYESWSTMVGYEDVVASDPVGGTNNARAIVVPVPGIASIGSGMTAVPSAISIQVMNPEALQTTTGILAGAVCSTQMDLTDRTETFNDISSEVISYFKPRLMSAAKLALRGVQANSYPLNMSAVSDFRSVSNDTLDGAVFTLGGELRPEGWAPIVVINNNNVDLQILVAVEWRVRFDIGNPAVSSHVHHGVTPDHQWNKMMQTAINMGNGIMDIVEKVASAGQVVENVARATSLI